MSDDDPQLRNMIRLILEPDYDLLVGADGLEAIRISRACKGPIDLLLTDVEMPEMDGLQLHGLLRKERPRIKVLFMSGKPPHSGIGDSPSLPFLPKPFEAEGLRIAVKSILEAAAEPQVILVVDSNLPRRDRTARILSDHQYVVLTASTAEDAESLADTTARIDLVVSAVNIGGDTGVHVADHMDASDRQISTLLISHALLSELNKIPGFAEQPEFLENPFSPEELLERVHKLLERRKR